MKRLLKLWLAILAAFWFMRAAVSALLFQETDRGFAAFFQVVTIPALQALVIGWVTRDRAAPSPLLPLRAAWQRPLLRGLLLADAAVLALGWGLRHQSWIGLSGGTGLPGLWIGLKLLGAGAVAAALAYRKHPEDSEDNGSRVWLALAAVALIALSSTPFLGWLWRVPDLLLPVLHAAVAREILVQALLASAVTAILLRVQEGFASHNAAAAVALGWTIGLGLLASSTAALAIFSDLALEEPWDALVQTFASLAATSVLAGMALAALAGPDLASTSQA